VPADLPGWLDGLGTEWVGLSLTMPLKQTVLPLLDAVSPLAVATGAANTVVLGPGGRSGDNTDVAGLVDALREAGVHRVGRGVVVGGGATAASALAALAELGDRTPLVLVRDRSRTGPLLAAAERLGVQPQVAPLGPGGLDGADVVISTLPAGAADPLAADLPAYGGVLLDVVYAPWPTALARAWPGPVVGGGAMLLHQAARQVELMTGRDAPLAAMRAALPPGLV
jgi:shikimate dehydrogenase